MSKTPEGQLLRLVQDWLTAKGILHFRMNTLAMPTPDGKRFIKAGTPGMADLLVFKACSGWLLDADVFWIELKAGKGKQSEAQKSFQALVELHGHRYIVARDLETVINALEG